MPTPPSDPATGPADTPGPDALEGFLLAARRRRPLPEAPTLQVAAAPEAQDTVHVDSGDPATPSILPKEVEAQIRLAESDPSRRIGRFVKLRLLGRGGMGEVHLAWDPALAREIALKLIRPREGDDQPKMLERLLREARVVARLRHQGIVAIFEVGEADGTPYLAMEYVPGRTLAAELQARKPGDLRLQVTRLRDIAVALGCAHGQGVVHRDLKPGNVLVDPEGRIFVTDFGLAKDLRRDLGTVTGIVKGTPCYMSPEQARGERVGPASDVFSLGVILYEIVVGVRPFVGDSMMEVLYQVMENEPIRPSSFDETVPRDLEVICLKSLDKDPARRYPNARELADDLDRWIQGEPILARPTTVVHRAWRKVRRHPITSAVLAAGVLAIAGSGAYLGLRTVWEHAEARALLAEGRRAEGRGDLGAAVQAYSQAARLWSDGDGVSTALERARAGLSARERVHRLAMEAEEFLTGLVDVRARAGEEAAARVCARVEEIVRRMEAEAVRSPEIPYVRGRLLFAQGRYEEAASEARAAVALDPRFAAGWLYLGIIQYTGFLRSRLPAAGANSGMLGNPVLVREASRTTGTSDPRRVEAEHAFQRALAEGLARSRPASSRFVAAMRAQFDGRFADAVEEFGRLAEEPGWIGDQAIAGQAACASTLDAAKAIPILENANRWRPGLDLIACPLAEKYDESRRHDRLESLAVDRETAAPGSALAVYLRGRHCESLGKLDIAESTYTKAIALRPDMLWAVFRRGVVRLVRRTPSTARADFDAILFLGFNEGVLANRGLAFVAEGRYQEAIADFSQLIDLRPEAAQFWALRGDARVRGGLPGAREDLDRALELDPNQPFARIAVGRLHIQAREWDEAIRCFEPVARTCPSNEDAQNLLAWTWFNKGDARRAIEVLDAALQAIPSSAELWSLRGDIVDQEGRHDEALHDFGEAIRLQPAMGEAYLLRGQALEKTQRSKEATADFEKAASLGLPMAEQYHRAATLSIRLDDAEAVLRIVEPGIEKFPEDPSLRIDRATARVALGDAKGAEEDCSAVLHRDPSNAPALYLRGWLFREQGRTEEARRDWEELVRVSPSSSWAAEARAWLDEH